MQEFLKKNSVKSVLLGIVPVILGGFITVAFEVKDNSYKFIIGGITFILFFLYIRLLIIYSRQDVDLQKKIAILTKENQSLSKTISQFLGICKISSIGINSIAHSIVDSAVINKKIWCFDKECQDICSAVYNIFSEICIENNGLEVTYVKNLEEKKNIVKTVGYENGGEGHPKVFNVERSVKDIDAHYDAHLFLRNNSSIVAYNNSDRIYEQFQYKNRKGKQYKYSQYIAVPVYCNDEKMIGLIQVVARTETIIAKEVKDLKILAKKYIMPFVHLAVLLSKAEKVMCSVPKDSSAKKE